MNKPLPTSTLYIIGNGFDLHHNLKTKYSDFHKYVQVNNPELEVKLGKHFNFKTDDNYLWTDFENDLCHFDHAGFLDSYDNIDVMSESFRPSEFFGLEDEVTEEAEALVEEIKNEFREWIESIEFTEGGDYNITKFQFESHAIFLNFNYTDTLEEIYAIPKAKITYIHNNASAYDGELIFGHGQKKEELPADAEFDETGESNRTQRTDSENASRTPFFEFQKDTNEIIIAHQQFFESLNKVKKVIVLGHSLGEVDWPYFRAIVDNTKKPNWRVSYFNMGERDLKKGIAVEILGKDSNIEMFQMTDFLPHG